LCGGGDEGESAESEGGDVKVVRVKLLGVEGMRVKAVKAKI
jgi:hypothetical protein